ncbi:MAG: helix-turn-helix domain-containing protein [Oscillospiraceae bacterium]|nr:helix-turn-helix domain-containing protein [Oscillospiraceae bacterium]
MLWHFPSPAALGGLFNETYRTVIHPLLLFVGIFGVWGLPLPLYRPIARAGGAALFASVALFLLFPQARLALSFPIALAVGLTGSALVLPYVYLLNNTEKLYSVLCMNLTAALLCLLYQTGLLRGAAEQFACAAALLPALLPTAWFERDALTGQGAPPRPPQAPKPTRVTYFSLWLNFGFAASVLGGGLLVLSRVCAANPAAHCAVQYTGLLAGGGCYVAVFARARESQRVAWAATFSAFFLAMFFHAAWPQNVMLSMASAFLIGFSMAIGLLNMFYNFGVLGKKFGMRLHLVETLCFAFAGGSLCVAIGRLSPSFPSEDVAVTVMIASALLLAGYFISAPVLGRTYFAEDWVIDSEYAEVGAAEALRPAPQPAPPAFLFEDFLAQVKTLTPTELVLLEYYAQGKNTEEILALMYIAPSTLKNHNSHIFRKLHVASRDELLLYLDLLRKCELLGTLFPAKANNVKNVK